MMLPLAVTQADEGLYIIVGMLITGLVFAAIVVVGEYVHYRRHFRRRH